MSFCTQALLPQNRALQRAPDARSALGVAGLGVLGPDTRQQRQVAQTLPLHIAGTAHQLRVVAGRTDLKHRALYRDRLSMQVLSNDKLQIDPCAKYAVAFPKRTRAVHTRASWTRNRLITICTALTGSASTPLSLLCLCAMTQLNSV